MTCQVTGEVSDDNFKLADGKLILSPEGAQRVLVELKNMLENYYSEE
jgi:transcriptional pleiotropic regulator of transition state genes